MKNKKLIVFDVGNTLIDTKRGVFISKQVLRDLTALKEKGYILGLSTLRTEEMLAPLFEQFQFDFLVLMNGGLVKIGERIVFSQPLGDDIIANIRLQAKALDVSVKEYSYGGQIYALELLAAKDKFTISDAYQAYVWKKSGSIDITPKNITKPKGLSIVCREFGIAPKDTIAFGDGYNDIDMLKTAGISVAMGGAPEAVNAVATITTTSAGEDGISAALRRLGIL